MTTHSTARGAGLERAYHHWRERGALLSLAADPKVEPPMSIAISREYGAGSTAIAQALAAKLGWPVYDRELVDKIAEDSGVRSKLLEDLDEKQPNWLTECMDSYAEEKHLTGAGFAIKLRQILLALYCHGNCILVGRGAAQVLPARRTLRVRLVAPLLYRVQRATDHLGISNAAEREVTEIDRQRADFVKRYFHKDVAEVQNYDLTLETSRFGEIQCRDLILAALRARQERLTAQK